MKANRKFINNDDAVSPVIAVILLVAITVVLAASIWFIVNGMTDTADKAPTAVYQVKDANDKAAAFNVTCVSGDKIKIAELEFRINGASITTGTYIPSDATYFEAGYVWYSGILTDPLTSGDLITIVHTPTNTAILSKIVA
ncbi:MAG: hypothetical protein CVT48_06935 [Thermoplasmata archaeon HGW-Thermoplasmata-1]|nr:MAG: hypothetical protein CVT48_06935 [Thermoplasmata archaeon HGW-Thermoplasmata-1]